MHAVKKTSVVGLADRLVALLEKEIDNAVARGELDGSCGMAYPYGLKGAEVEEVAGMHLGSIRDAMTCVIGCRLSAHKNA